MMTIRELQQAICELSLEDLTAFRTWFAVFDADIWDQQLEEGVAARRLDTLADEALWDLQEGHCTDL